MPVRPSGAPTRANKSTKSGPKKSAAPKSFKADGTPKKRWSAAERAEQGHGARRRGGQSASSGFRSERSANERSFDADSAPRSFDRERPRTNDRPVVGLGG